MAPIPDAGAGPPPSVGHDLVYDDALHAVLLVNAGLGSHDDANMAGQPNRIWSWDGVRWTLLDSSGPHVRNLGGVAYDSRRDKLVFHGGTFSASLSFSDTWEWDPQGGWRRFDVPGPGTRDHTQMTYDPERGVTVLFGGQGSPTSFPGETWQWDGARWTSMAAAGPAPPVHHAMSFDPVQKRVLLFGGVGTRSDLGDTWAWDGSAWRESAQAITPRTHARLAPYEGLLLIGGSDARGVVSDNLVWDGASWRTHAFAGPPARYLTGVAYDRARNKTVLFGGGGADDRLLADTWEFDGTAWKRVDLAAMN
jgi:hypothetical protein